MQRLSSCDLAHSLSVMSPKFIHVEQGRISFFPKTENTTLYIYSNGLYLFVYQWVFMWFPVLHHYENPAVNVGCRCLFHILTSAQFNKPPEVRLLCHTVVLFLFLVGFFLRPLHFLESLPWLMFSQIASKGNKYLEKSKCIHIHHFVGLLENNTTDLRFSLRPVCS